MEKINLNLTQSKFNSLLLDFLIDIKVELEATRNLCIGEYIYHTKEDLSKINEALVEIKKHSRLGIMAHLKEKYGLDSVDDLLNSVS